MPVGPTVSPELRLNHDYIYLHIYCEWLYSPLFYLFSINPLKLSLEIGYIHEAMTTVYTVNIYL